MKTRNRQTKLLATALVIGLIAASLAAWGARPAQAIIIQNGKTGLFTLTESEAARVNVVNTGEQGIIVAGGGILDSAGNMLAEFPERRLAPGEGTSFEFIPPDPQRQMFRAELMISGGSTRRGGVSFIPTLEVFDTATGRSSVGHDFIIDDGE
jgi:hypothetical protein